MKNSSIALAALAGLAAYMFLTSRRQSGANAPAAYAPVDMTGFHLPVNPLYDWARQQAAIAAAGAAQNAAGAIDMTGFLTPTQWIKPEPAPATQIYGGQRPASYDPNSPLLTPYDPNVPAIYQGTTL